MVLLKFSFFSLCRLYHKLPNKRYVHSFHSFSQVQMEQMEKLDLVTVLDKLSCKSFREFYTPFLLNSFVEHVPVLHICSFFLLSVLVPRFPVYLFRQSGYCFSLAGAPFFALNTWSAEKTFQTLIAKWGTNLTLLDKKHFNIKFSLKMGLS